MKKNRCWVWLLLILALACKERSHPDPHAIHPKMGTKTSLHLLGFSPPAFQASLLLSSDLKGLELSSLTLGEDACDHSHQTSPSELKKLVNADKIILWSLEDKKLAEHFSLPPDRLVFLDPEISDSTLETDEHTWLSPERVLLQSRKLADSLAQWFPEEQATIHKRFEEFKGEVEEKSKKLDSILLPVRHLSWMSHYPFLHHFNSYFRLGEKGFLMKAPHQSLNPKLWQERSQFVQKHKLGFLLYEQHSQSTPPQNVISFAKANWMRAIPIHMTQKEMGKNFFLLTWENLAKDLLTMAEKQN